MAMARAVWGFIERRDHRLMRKMNRWPPPRWVRYWMIWATRAGDGWLWYGLGVMILLFGGPRRFPTLGATGFAAVAGIVLFKVLKNLSRRLRPCQIEPHCWADVLP